MYKSQADAMKDWLISFRLEEERIAELQEQRAMLRASMTSISAQEISDMPRSPSSFKDRMTDDVIRMEALEAKIAAKTASQESCRRSIQTAVNSLRRENAREIIRLRYLNGKEWAEIMRILYQREPDFLQKQSKYRRKMFRQHEGALKEMSKNWRGGNGNDQ